MRNHAIGRSLFAAGLAIVSLSGDDIGWSLGGAAIGAGLIFLLGGVPVPRARATVIVRLPSGRRTVT